jgi:hypothetical protein
MGTEVGVHHENGSPEASHPKEVIVTVDGKNFEVRAGTYLVSAFKALVGVDPSRELDEIVHGEFVPLNDGATITIEKHERFVSHVRTGSSS